MKSTAIDKALSIFKQHPGALHTYQVIRLGIAPGTLYALRDAGQVLELTRDVFCLPEHPFHEHEDLIQVAMRIPKGIIYLVSALAFHGLTTQIPHAVYLALPIEAEKPRMAYPPLRIFWLSKAVYAAGAEEHTLDGVPVRIFGQEKTIADCFKFRNKIGLEVALEALKNGLARGCQPQTVLEYARVEKTIRPYLEALL